VASRSIDEEEEITKKCEERGLPDPPGKRAKFNISVMSLQKRW